MAAMTIPTIFTAVDKFSNVVFAMNTGVSDFASNVETSFDKVNKKLSKVRNVALVGATAITGGLTYAATKAIDFEDKMADVAKTTGLSGKELSDFGSDLLDMSTKTRSSIDDLQTIAEIGGRLGIAKNDLAGFTNEANKFAVALGGDFSGGVESAITQFSKLAPLFKDTKTLNISDALRQTGSAFNALSSKGINVEQLTDFALRLGALPDAFKPSIREAAALGATLQKTGLSSEIASGGFTNIILTASKELPAFAKQMGLTTRQARELLNTNTIGFFAKFAKSVQGVPADKLAIKMAKLKINSQEAIKTVGAVSGQIGLLSEFTNLSNSAFEKGLSITDEYNTKNNTSAALWAKVKNNVDALVISVGTELLPIITEYLPVVSNAIKSSSDWIKENRGLVKIVAIAGVALWGLSAAISAVQIVMTVGKFVMLAYSATTAAYSALAVTAALGTGSFAAAIWALMWPIIAVIAVIGSIVAAIIYWDEICAWFGKQWASFTNFIGETWDALTSWFEEFSFSEFFKDIGNSIIEFLLTPLQWVLSVLSYLPGDVGEKAKEALKFIDGLTSDVDINKSIDTTKTPRLDSPMETNSQMMYNNRFQGGIDINVKDKGGNVGGVTPSGFNGLPVRVTPTQGVPA